MNATFFAVQVQAVYKRDESKHTHKSSIAAGDMLKLRGYFSEGLDSNLGQIPSDFYSLCGFQFVFILVAAEEKDGESSLSNHSE